MMTWDCRAPADSQLLPVMSQTIIDIINQNIDKWFDNQAALHHQLLD